jgi:hypothetical protein
VESGGFTARDRDDPFDPHHLMAHVSGQEHGGGLNWETKMVLFICKEERGIVRDLFYNQRGQLGAFQLDGLYFPGGRKQRSPGWGIPAEWGQPPRNRHALP